MASTFGFILVINPAIALMALATWLVFAFLFKYSSLAALAAAVLTPLYAYFYAGEVESVFSPRSLFWWLSAIMPTSAG